MSGAADMSPVGLEAGKLEPLNTPWSKAWVAERAATPSSPKPESRPTGLERTSSLPSVPGPSHAHRSRARSVPAAAVVGDALTYLNKRTKRQQMMNDVKKFKTDTLTVLTEAREAGTPGKGLTEAVRLQLKEINTTMRQLNFEEEESKPQAPPFPDYTKRGDAISIALSYLNKRSKAKEAKAEAEKVDKVKESIAPLLDAAKESGVPDYLLEDALNETLAEIESAA